MYSERHESEQRIQHDYSLYVQLQEQLEVLNQRGIQRLEILRQIVQWYGRQEIFNIIVETLQVLHILQLIRIEMSLLHEIQ